jgi:hypothetical protein
VIVHPHCQKHEDNTYRGIDQMPFQEEELIVVLLLSNDTACAEHHRDANSYKCYRHNE